MINDHITKYLVSLCNLGEFNYISALEHITLARAELGNCYDYFFSVCLEAEYTLFKLEEVLAEGDTNLVLNLVVFFANRWERIKNCDMQYLHDFTNPANKACIAIARLLNQQYYLALLMPSLVNKNITYLTSSYDDEDLELKEMIISDDNSALIHLSDVLSFAQIDGKLKHNSLLEGNQRQLSRREKNRLLSRDTTVKDYYDSLLARRAYRFSGDTMGAALNRLIEGLFGGGVSRDGEEFNAGDAANIAIVDFFDFLATYPEDVQQRIRETSCVNEFADEGDRDESISLGTLFERLTYKKKFISSSSSDGDYDSYENSIVEEQAELDDTISIEEMQQDPSDEPHNMPQIASSIDEGSDSYEHSIVEEEQEELDDTIPIEDMQPNPLDESFNMPPIPRMGIIQELTSEYCVELIAQDIRRVLDEHDELFDLSPQTDFVTQSLARLDENVFFSMQQYQMSILTLAKHYAYQELEPNFECLIKALSASPQFKLDSKQIGLIVKELFVHKFKEGESIYVDDFFNYLGDNYKRSFLKTICTSLNRQEKRYFNQRAALSIEQDDDAHNFLKPRKKREREPDSISDEELDVSSFAHG